MRIRQVKPDFWRDSVLAQMSDGVRLVYIGLWMEADDAGFLRLDMTEIARDLWDTSKAVRERRLNDAMAVLVAAERVVIQECKRHAFIPHLTEHQRLAAPDKRVTTVQREHRLKCIEPVPADTRGDLPTFHMSPTRNVKGKEGEGKERGGVGGSAVGADGSIEDDGSTTSEFRRLVPMPRKSA